MLKKIAYESIKDSLEGKGISRPSHLTDNLLAKCGAFVSLHKQNRLRGCIGHFGEDVPLHEIVAEMARAAAFEDPRFVPVSHEELDDIDIEISVLTPMRRIQSLDEFEMHRHGIYIRKGYRSGTKKSLSATVLRTRPDLAGKAGAMLNYMCTKQSFSNGVQILYQTKRWGCRVSTLSPSL